jgi:acyl-coenzyme A synthetase/AMP-(fatty) acid ligase
MQTSLRSLLAAGADNDPAISAPSRTTLTFSGLRELVDVTLGSLNSLGIGRNDRVAIVLPNGPEMATCFLACARA